MDIILTHEQADFDALASLLGAHLLNEAATPVLPRRLNRNVRAYITLYGLDLPFVDPRDLPNKPIKNVTLVDTQSLTSLKGMGAKTKVQVIDHHPPRPDLPPDWSITTEELGALTTLLVEGLRERNGHLSAPQATLLLMGIYEDTGSLTYSRTTARDARAAAYLLEQGASLQVASNFLNHPLSQEQQALYDQVREAAESHIVNGHNLIVACGDAKDLDEELSSIAHKMRDLLDPEALFLLIATGAGVQLIARSTSDYVDVAKVAERFGGGGHARASAALVKGRGVNDVYEELIEILPEFVPPAILVADIMSREPHLLSENTPVKDVAERMQRYGYEGYPVVRDGRVVGLLTRRAVDRALAHKLNLKAAEVMEAGEVTITPEASIEALQRKMTDTGWGQIPVVALESGEVIGIVTRTDLLKTLAPEEIPSGRQNLAARLEAALPAAQLAFLRLAADAAHEQHAALFIVGGFVRDLLLERPSLDYDLVVEGDAIALAHSLAEQYGGRLTTHKRFGTAKWRIAAIRPELAERLSEWAGKNLNPDELPQNLDLISARREFYPHPSALPRVERGSIKLDLHRRDFTINTLALRLDGHHYGQLHDYWGGLEDLKNGQVRVLHTLSFVDDPTRILRAVRFEQRFGFAIEERTLELLQAALPLLDRVSGDRIRHELEAILGEAQAAAMLERLSKLGVLEAVHPALKWDGQACGPIIANPPQKLPEAEWGLGRGLALSELRLHLAYLCWFSALPIAEVADVAKRLKLPGDLHTATRATVELKRGLPALVKAPVSQVAELLDQVPPLVVYALHEMIGDKKQRALLQKYVSEWRGLRPVTTGDDLRARGVPPGPVYKRVLTHLRNAWLDGELTSGEEEQARLEELLRE